MANTIEEIQEIFITPIDSLKEANYSLLKETIRDRQLSVDPRFWEKSIYKLMDIVRQKEGIEAALKNAKGNIDSFSKNCVNQFGMKMRLQEFLCKEYLKSNKQDSAHEAMNKYVFNALSKIQFEESPGRMSYFSFRPFSPYSLEDVKLERISTAHPREFNDPLDTILLYWLKNRISDKELAKNDVEYKFALLLKKVSESIKLRCLIGSDYRDGGEIIHRRIEDMSVLMWSHYAKSHTGFCIEYDFDRSLFDVDPSGQKVLVLKPVKYPDVITIDGAPSFEKALFEKSNFWEYEQEMRLVLFDYKIYEDGHNYDYPSISCKGMMKAIYLGVNCSDEDRLKMEKAIANKDIPLFQMQIDDSNITRFKKVQIG